MENQKTVHEILVEESVVEHTDQNEAVQVHDQPDGSAVITFSDKFLEYNDWRVGDSIVFDISETEPRIFNKTADSRKVTVAD